MGDASTAGAAARQPRSADDDVGDPERNGVRDSLARFGGTLLNALDTRVQLAALEFAEERERARQRVVLLLTLAIAVAFGLLAVQTLLVVVTWDELGWRILALLTALWTVIAALAGWRLSASMTRESRPFSATLDELHRDRLWLGERLGRRRP